MTEHGASIQPQLGTAAGREQPEPATEPMLNGMATSEPGNGQMEDKAADEGNMQDVEAAIDIGGEGSRSGTPSRSAAAGSPESRTEADFEFLWRLRKYLLLLAVLAVSVTYNAGLNPPGGFQMDSTLHHSAIPGDPLLPVKFFRRYEAFFYCNATAFATSLVLIILLLSRGVASKRLWLRSMQVTMILDLFSLMGAYAAGSCRALRSSVYILVLVCAVFVYIGIHILVFIRVVPMWIKEKVQKILHLILEKLHGMLNHIKQMLSICPVSGVGEQRNSGDEEEEIEEARKFILMLATFAATITYQAGMNPPGGFWGVNVHGYRPGTFVLRRHNRLRFNIFTCCNATSFVASLVTVILLLSTELSMHGIRTKALFVCVIADLFGLIGAYASGSSRNVATSLSVVLIVIVVLICVLILVMFLQSETATFWIDKELKPAVNKFLSMLSWGRDSHLSNLKQNDSQKTHQQGTELDSQRTQPEDTELDSPRTQHQDTELDCQHTTQQETELDSQRTHQQDTELDSQRTQQDRELGSKRSQQQYTEHSSRDTEVNGGVSNLQSCSADSNLVSTGDVRSASASDLNSMEENNPSVLNQSHDWSEQAVETVCSSSTDALTTEEIHTHNIEVQFAGSQQIAIPMGPSSPSDSGKPIHGILPLQGSVDQNAASGDLRMEKSSEEQLILPRSHGDAAENHAQPMSSHHIGVENGGEIKLEIGGTENGQAAQHEEKSSDCSYRNPEDVLLKKSRTYLLLLAILAVSLTYQAGLNPPGGFWTSNVSDHSAGDPILEDNYHKRYLAFFYFNATAFAASLVIILMLLSRKMSNRVIKRRAVQTAMITDMLALMGAFVVGSCREKTKSIYISVVIFPVVAYVSLHVLVSRHIIPGWKECVSKRIIPGWKDCVLPKSPQTDKKSRDAMEKDLERRRNLLLILAILAATVTYQAGLNPPGGIWPDEHSKGGRPGNPVLQDSHPRRYDVFYYSNSVSFVSSVAVIILLVNRESCEHGIKSYALRVCLIAGLLGLLVAYSAGSCRKVKSVIYLIVIAAAVLICLAVQFLVLSSTQGALEGPLTWLRTWLRKIFHLKTDSGVPLDSSEESNKKNNAPGSAPQINDKKERKRQKYLMLLAILAASIAYQAGLNPPGGFWPDDTSSGYKAGNPVLKDINYRRYLVFFVFNSISFMSSIAVVLLLLSKSVRKKKVPLQALHVIMILDLLALMTAYAAGSCRKFRTSIFVLVVVCCVVVYLLVVIILSSGIAKWLKKKKGRWLPCWGCPSHDTATDTLPPVRDV
ncbi:uncharacterized protein LOC124671547 [Lolium rigidum]|uniref:uncharacterized protein LOC124671547 n=1 Tax=Lolium rigidum TaxID=89674 RepID=UPI001F5C6200|nr:uncharacterized protein LOC124671547 [Lolium rigidum]